MSRNGEKVLWFVIGAAVGAGIALLYAPKTGKDTRRYIRKTAGNARDTLVETSEQIVDRGRDIYKKSTEVANDAAELFERGRRAMGVGIGR